MQAPQYREPAHMQDGKADIPLELMPPTSSPDVELALQELRNYSSSLLHEVVFGNGGVNKRRLLNAVYWRTIELLAHME